MQSAAKHLYRNSKPNRVDYAHGKQGFCTESVSEVCPAL